MSTPAHHDIHHQPVSHVTTAGYHPSTHHHITPPPLHHQEMAHISPIPHMSTPAHHDPYHHPEPVHQHHDAPHHHPHGGHPECSYSNSFYYQLTFCLHDPDYPVALLSAELARNHGMVTRVLSDVP